MKRFLLIITATLLINTAEALAQFTISNDKPATAAEAGKLDTAPTVSGTNVDNQYFDPTVAHLEKLRLRKERNYFEFNASLKTTLQQFDNWQAGGDNTFSGLATIFMQHKYENKLFSSSLTINARYGINVIDNDPFKNADEFKLSETMGWQMNDSWSYSALINFRTQFANGYKSRSDKTLISSLLSPGYLDVAVGLTYKKDGSPFVVTLSPLSGNMTMVTNPDVWANKNYGVEEGKTIPNQIGSSVNINFDKTFGEKKNIRYRATFYTFYDYRTPPTVRWDNTLDYDLTKYLSLQLYGVAYYHKPSSNKMQYQYSATIGLAYKFKNK